MFLFNWVDSPTPNLPRLSGDVETLSQGMVENEQAAPLSAPYKVKNRDPDTNGRPGVANSFGPEIGRFYPPAPTDRFVQPLQIIFVLTPCQEKI